MLNCNQPTNLKSLGVTVDCWLRLNRVTKYAQYTSTLSYSSCTQQQSSIAASRIDHCNSLLHDAPAATIDKLPLVQSSPSRTVTRIHIRPVPVKWWHRSIGFLCMRASRSKLQPTSSAPSFYFHCLIQPNVPACGLRSASSSALVMTQTDWLIELRFHVPLGTK